MEQQIPLEGLQHETVVSYSLITASRVDPSWRFRISSGKKRLDIFIRFYCVSKQHCVNPHCYLVSCADTSLNTMSFFTYWYWFKVYVVCHISKTVLDQLMQHLVEFLFANREDVLNTARMWRVHCWPLQTAMVKYYTLQSETKWNWSLLAIKNSGLKFILKVQIAGSSRNR